MPVQRDVLAPLQGLRETHLEWPWVGKMRRTEHKHGKKEWGAETSSGRTMQGFEAEPTTTAMLTAGFAPSCFPHLRVALGGRWLP